MKFLFIVVAVCASVQISNANITNDEISEIIKKLELYVRQLNDLKAAYDKEINYFLEELKEHVTDENGDEGGNCFDTLVKAYLSDVNLVLDEGIGGYIRSSSSLINDIKSGFLEGEELVHTKHMLSDQGSFKQQLINVILYVAKQIHLKTINFDKMVHEQCCKHH